MRIGIAGIGYWGSKLVKEYARLLDEGRIDALAIYDIDKSRLFNTKVIPYLNLDEFLDSIDAIHIASSNESHYSIALEALERGKHVLVEKPMTLNSKDAYALIDVAKDNGCILQVGHIFRFSNVLREVKRLYDKGYFGSIRYIKLRWSNYKPYTKIDILWDLLPHPIDIINYLTDDWLRDIDCYRIKSDGLNVAASLNAYVSSIIANVEVSFLHPLKERRLEIIGDERSAIIDCVDQIIEVYPSNEPIYVAYNNTIREEITNFIDSIIYNRSYCNSAIVGAKTVELIESII